MLPLIGAALLGAIAMGRTKPKTKAARMTLLGPRSGCAYEVEDFQSAGFLVVRAPDGATATFRRKSVSKPGAPGFEWQHGSGSRETLAMIIRDICGEVPKKKKSEDGDE